MSTKYYLMLVRYDQIVFVLYVSFVVMESSTQVIKGKLYTGGERFTLRRNTYALLVSGIKSTINQSGVRTKYFKFNL